MAIYTQKEKYENPRNLGFESSLAPIDLKYSALTDAVDAYSQMQDKAEAREQKNFDSFKTHYDALTSIPLDNEQQRDKFQEVRKRHGIGDDAFSEIALDPSNPRSVAKLERGFGRLSTDRDFQEILQEQQRAAAYMNGCRRPHRERVSSDHWPSSGSITASTTMAIMTVKMNGLSSPPPYPVAKARTAMSP